MVSSFQRDLEARQNREMTSAQKLQLENTKKYVNNDIKEGIKELGNNKKMTDFTHDGMTNAEMSKLCRILGRGDTRNEEINHLKLSFNNQREVVVYDKKIILVSEDKNTKISFILRVDVMCEIISALKKIDKWLEAKGYDGMKCDDILIPRYEIQTAVRVFESLDRIKNNEK